jgi:hypothetical protein
MMTRVINAAASNFVLHSLQALVAKALRFHGIKSIVIYARTSKRLGADRAAIDTSIERQITFLQRVCPPDFPVVATIKAGKRSAYSGEALQYMEKCLKGLASPFCLVSTSLDRCVRRTSSLSDVDTMLLPCDSGNQLFGIRNMFRQSIAMSFLWAPAITVDTMDGLRLPDDCSDATYEVREWEKALQLSQRRGADSKNLPSLVPIIWSQHDDPSHIKTCGLIAAHAQSAQNFAQSVPGTYSNGLKSGPVPAALADVGSRNFDQARGSAWKNFIIEQLALLPAQLKIFFSRFNNSWQCECETGTKQHDSSCHCPCAFCKRLRQACLCTWGHCDCDEVCDCCCAVCHKVGLPRSM